LCPAPKKSDLKDRDVSNKCEYLIGDDTCSAVKEEELSYLRVKECQNETKDKCCYKCSYMEKCDIRCDLLDNRDEKIDGDSPNTQASQNERGSETLCGDCTFYLEPKCPRGYTDDQELWRRQQGCKRFRPKRQKP
jgi:hypothetical protein